MAKSRHWKTAVFNGLRNKCPHCGGAPLFKAYLKQVDSCSSCGQTWSEVRADDGPAWATMLIVGHMMAPFFHFFIFNKTLPTWAATLILIGMGLVLSLILLPRVKGGFIGLIWATGAPTS